MGPDLVLREEEVSIVSGYTLNGLVGLLKRVLHLTGVVHVVVTPQSVQVARYVLPAEPVIPPEEGRQEPPPFDAMLSKPIETLLETENRSPYIRLQSACDILQERGLRPSLIVGPKDPDVIRRFFSLEGEKALPHLMGVPVEYELGEEYHEQLLIFGGRTYLFDDVEAGVSIDMGST